MARQCDWLRTDVFRRALQVYKAIRHGTTAVAIKKLTGIVSPLADSRMWRTTYPCHWRRRTAFQLSNGPNISTHCLIDPTPRTLLLANGSIKGNFWLCRAYHSLHQRRDLCAAGAQVGDKHTLYQLRKEIAILKKVSYDANIVQFYGASTTEPAMLVMEFMEVCSRQGRIQGLGWGRDSTSCFGCVVWPAQTVRSSG